MIRKLIKFKKTKEKNNCLKIINKSRFKMFKNKIKKFWINKIRSCKMMILKKCLYKINDNQ